MFLLPKNARSRLLGVNGKCTVAPPLVASTAGVDPGLSELVLPLFHYMHSQSTLPICTILLKCHCAKHTADGVYGQVKVIEGVSFWLINLGCVLSLWV